MKECKVEEVWADIEGYEGLYQISNQGATRSLDREVIYPQGHTRIQRGKTLKPDINNGYECVRLYRDKMGKWKKIHRLVAMAFIPNPENKEQVNHKNGIKNNNRVENLEWNTQLENMQHAAKNGLIPIRKGVDAPNYGMTPNANQLRGLEFGRFNKAVATIAIHGDGRIDEYISMAEASRCCGVKRDVLKVGFSKSRKEFTHEATGITFKRNT